MSGRERGRTRREELRKGNERRNSLKIRLGNCCGHHHPMVLLMAIAVFLATKTTTTGASFVQSHQQQQQQQQPSANNNRYNRNSRDNDSCLGGSGSTSNDNFIGSERARQIMYNQQSRKREMITYQVIAAEACEPLARRIEEVSVRYWLVNLLNILFHLCPRHGFLHFSNTLIANNNINQRITI